jgi:thymidylate synthase
MYVSNVRNVCEALPATLELLVLHGVSDDSRAGRVLVLPAPLMTATAQPRERVLRSAARDANPFFHMVESIWMLAGRDDAAPLNLYIKKFGETFSEQINNPTRELGDPLPETNGMIHDAYGRRWLYGLGFNQLDAVIKRLIENPRDRQCVIAMWDPRPEGNDDLQWDWRTRPCNTHIYLRVHEDVLDMTVCCRSNDMIWGGHGANAVHFSILQEYLAARIDVGIGKMYQLSNNAHAYVAELERIDRRITNHPQSFYVDHYVSGEVTPDPMFTEPDEIDNDVKEAMRWHDNPEDAPPVFSNVWFSVTFVPAVIAHRMHRFGNTGMAIKVAGTMSSSDWRFACVEWLQRRVK